MNARIAGFAAAATAAAAILALVRVGYGASPEPSLAQLRSHVKHVFVIYQENHSFDNYFGTYPGADNLATAQARSHGFRQYDPIGKQWVTPFRIADPDIAGPAHAREVMVAKIDGGRMDRYVATQERVSLREYDPSDAQRIGLITMAHYDCDTIPYLWMYASRFALYDHVFDGMAGPSTPGNLEAIAGQTGQTQRARNPVAGDADVRGPGVPVLDDLDPRFGPYPGRHSKQLQVDQRYATIFLALGGKTDAGPLRDTQGVRRDLAAVAARGYAAIPWGWYQEGYEGPNATALRGYETHHNAPQYFGYLRKNALFWNNEHGLPQLLAQLRDGTLPARSVTYVKGASYNHFGWHPANRNPFVQAHFMGDDDHPGTDDSDRAVADEFVATFVNAIAHSRYWKSSAIVVTWDDDGGFYDHVPPPQFERCSDGHPCGDGGRVPLLLISPYAKSGRIVSEVGDTSSIVRFVEKIFDVPALATLPDEAPYLPQGPRDTNPRLSDLLAGFSSARLSGTIPPIPASSAEIPSAVVRSIPSPWNCSTLHVQPVAVPGASLLPPKGFAPRTARYVP